MHEKNSMELSKGLLFYHLLKYHQREAVVLEKDGTWKWSWLESMISSERQNF
jgi:hypothetical protein